MLDSSRVSAPAELAQIPAGRVAYYWHGAEPYFAAAHERMGGETPTQLFERCIKRTADLWCVFADGEMLAAGIASIRDKTVRIETLGGRDVRAWVHLLAEFEDLARKHGMTAIEIEGRAGWGRLFRSYRVKRTIFGKAL